ncbi:NAD-dependent epimerase/dehydratase family protein [Micromonospora sp. NBC_01699]|uniref:NAD-dependent epimerase/dehydratase family protein n=1 Tax=Micromonospora sp. NBC_01699 TaxID=2975984 RepID=UPI002E29AADC|nr:NAD-dependent epimerase/dehydratase family protein [Micromonospora sp. NBC_01699]
MRILLTSASGYLGSAVLPALLLDGHEVTAIVRSDDAVATVTAAGAAAVRGDVTDSALLSQSARESDGVIHLVTPGGQISDALDNSVVDGVLVGLAGSGKFYIHSGGIWVHGNTNGVADEGSPFDPPEVTAWRPAIFDRVRNASGIRTVIISPGVVYGHGSGLPRMIVDGPQSSDPEPALLFPGTGDQHWTGIHIDDVATLYAAAVQRAKPGSYYLAVNGVNPTMREIATAASRTLGLNGRIAPEPPEETRRRLGPLAEAFGLDQQATGDLARAELGWKPIGPSLLDEIETGSYARRI